MLSHRSFLNAPAKATALASRLKVWRSNARPCPASTSFERPQPPAPDRVRPGLLIRPGGVPEPGCVREYTQREGILRVRWDDRVVQRAYCQEVVVCERAVRVWSLWSRVGDRRELQQPQGTASKQIVGDYRRSQHPHRSPSWRQHQPPAQPTQPPVTWGVGAHRTP